MAGSKKTPDFEQSLAALEALVARMEAGELSLEESLKAFEEGIKLTCECQTRLSEAEQRVQILLEQDGQVTLTPLEDSQD